MVSNMEKLALLISCYSALSEDTLHGGGKLLKACNILEDGNLKKLCEWGQAAVVQCKQLF